MARGRGMKTLILDKLKRNAKKMDLTHDTIDDAVTRYLKDGGTIKKFTDITELLPENIDSVTDTEKWRDFHGSKI